MQKITPVHVLVSLVAAACLLAIVGPAALRQPGASKIVGLALLGSLFTVGFAACTIVASAVWPDSVDRARDGLARRPLRCGLLGLLVVLLEIWISMLAGPARPLVITSFAIADLLALAQGLPALAALVGERVGAGSRPRAVAAGSVLFAATGALPIVGWALGAVLMMQAMGAALPGMGREAAGVAP